MKKDRSEVSIKNGVASPLRRHRLDTAAIIAEELGCKVEKEIIVIEERLIDVSEDKEEDLRPRAPVVVVAGPRDHGKPRCWTISAVSDAASPRGWRHHPAHRRSPGVGEGPAHYLPGHPWAMRRSPRARGADHRRGHSGGGRRRRHHASNRGVHQPRQGRRHPHHRGHQQDGCPRPTPSASSGSSPNTSWCPRRRRTIICPISARPAWGWTACTGDGAPHRRDAGAQANPDRSAHGDLSRPGWTRAAACLPCWSRTVPCIRRRHHRRHRRGPCPRHDQRQGQNSRRPDPPSPWRSSAWARCAGDDFHAVADERMAGSWWSSASRRTRTDSTALWARRSR